MNHARQTVGHQDSGLDPAIGTATTAAQLRPAGSRTQVFQGSEHGSGISFFLVENAPGHGPELHRHPYTETWTVLGGQATITMGEQEVVADEGTTAVVQPGVWHGFTNTGTDTLRMMCIHAAPHMVTEWLA